MRKPYTVKIQKDILLEKKEIFIFDLYTWNYFWISLGKVSAINVDPKGLNARHKNNRAKPPYSSLSNFKNLNKYSSCREKPFSDRNQENWINKSLNWFFDRVIKFKKQWINSIFLNFCKYSFSLCCIPCHVNMRTHR